MSAPNTSRHQSHSGGGGSRFCVRSADAPRRETSRTVPVLGDSHQIEIKVVAVCIATFSLVNFLPQLHTLHGKLIIEERLTTSQKNRDSANPRNASHS